MKIVYFETGRKFLVKDTSKDFHILYSKSLNIDDTSLYPLC